MFSILVSSLNPSWVKGQYQRANMVWLVWYMVLIILSGLLGFYMLYFGPKPAVLGWIIFLMGILAVLYRPTNGVYLILFFSLIGDALLAPWYPFVKNLSSVESLFYLGDQFIFSPLEIYLGLTLISWLGRAAFQRKIRIYLGPLFWPSMIFMAFVIIGLGYGLVRGGNTNVAIWEARPIFYLPLMMVLVSNLITTRQQVNVLMWTVMLAIVGLAIGGDLHYFLVLKGNLEGVNSITEHAAAVRMNTLFVFILGAWLYKGSATKRYLLVWSVPLVLIAYFATQRRAAFITLTIALVIMAIILYKENRRVFWLIVPPLLIVAGVYVIAFWNSTSTLGMPAQSIKSIVAQDQASLEDQLSNVYRIIENVNIWFTIHAAPITGIGFGQKFFRIVSMPNISFFIWWEYITHNSVLWVWMKTGVGGFLALLFLVGYSIMMGGKVLSRMPGGDLSAVAVTAVIYLIMHFIYAYVDMSWDMQSMLYVGAMMGLINSLEHIAEQPAPPVYQRWPWQLHLKVPASK